MKPYFSEEQICNWLWSTNYIHRHFSPIAWRERPIAFGLRPDFISLWTSGKKRYFGVHEVKISADLNAVEQVARYCQVVRRHICTWCYDSEYDLVLESEPKVYGFLLARVFDKSVYELAYACGIFLTRIKTNELNELYLEPEDNIWNNHIDNDFSSFSESVLMSLPDMEKKLSLT